MANFDLLRSWPKATNGDPEEAALLEVISDLPGYRDVVCSLLEGFDIPYYIRRDGVGEVAFIRGGFSPEGVKIYVPCSRLEEARNLLNTPVEFGEEEFEEEKS